MVKSCSIFGNSKAKTKQKMMTQGTYFEKFPACYKNGNLENTDVQNGRISKASLTNLIEKPEDCEFYFCGPKSFIVSLLEILQELQVPQNQISYEYFGPQLQ